MDIDIVLVNGGTVKVDADCAIVNYIDISSGGRLEVLDDGALEVRQINTHQQNSSVMVAGAAIVASMNLAEGDILVLPTGELEVSDTLTSSASVTVEGSIVASNVSLSFSGKLIVLATAAAHITGTFGTYYAQFDVRGSITASSMSIGLGSTFNVAPSGILNVTNDITIQQAVTNVHGSITATNLYLLSSGTNFNLLASGVLNVANDLIIQQAVTFVHGSITTTNLYLRDSANLNAVAGSTLSSLAKLEMKNTAQFRPDGHDLTIFHLVMDGSTIHCQSRCRFDVNTATFDDATIQADGVSTEHSACELYDATTIVTGADHAGCGGQFNCCPTGLLKPFGRFDYPRDVGRKGGTCSNDGAGLGGGALEITIGNIASASGFNFIRAIGGVPKTHVTNRGGGGSGGSILLSIPCYNTTLTNFLISVTGGDAFASSSSTEAYGGSGGRIAIYCTGGYYDIDAFPHIYRAYGGKNANHFGWGASGTVFFSAQHAEKGLTQQIHIIENPSYYSSSTFPYYPAPFLLFNSSATNGPDYTLLLISRSDVLFHADETVPESIDMRLVSLVDTDPGAVANMSPLNLDLTIHNNTVVPTIPRVPPNSGECWNYFTGKA